MPEIIVILEANGREIFLGNFSLATTDYQGVILVSISLVSICGKSVPISSMDQCIYEVSIIQQERFT